MALVLADRVKVSSSTSGTGPMTLGPAQFGFQSFAAVGDGNDTYYGIIDNVGNWEIGRGTWTASSNTLSRNTVVSSSNNGSLVNFPGGSKNVFATFPSSLAQANFASPAGLGNIAFYGNTIDVSSGSSITLNKNTTVNGNLTITGTVINGNAATATKLATPVTINGVSFDGSANVTVPAAANTLTGTTLNSTVVTSSLTSTGTVTSGTWSASFGAVSGANLTNLTADNLTGTIPAGVLGNSFVSVGTTVIALNRSPSAQSLTGVSIDGNAGTATALQTARNINGTLFDGRSDVTISAAANTLTGNTLSSSVVNSSLTSLGTLGSLTVVGPVSVTGNTTVSGYVSRQVPLLIKQNSTSQVLTNVTETLVSFDTAIDTVLDTGMVYDNSVNVGRFTNQSGSTRTYTVSVTVTYAPNNAGYRATYIKKNGTKIAEMKTPAVSGDDTAHHISTTVKLNNFEYIEIWAYHNCGTNLAIGSGDNFNGNEITVAWI